MLRFCGTYDRVCTYDTYDCVLTIVYSSRAAELSRTTNANSETWHLLTPLHKSIHKLHILLQINGQFRNLDYKLG